jgi:predicted TIM-barrel fold metal-dependent hydrolase
MQVIDFHTHIFPDKIARNALAVLAEDSGEYRPKTDGTLKGLMKSMDDAGIVMSVVSNIATKLSQVYPIYDFSCSIMSDRIYPMISLHPESTLIEAEDLLDKAKEKRIRGVKFHPQYQNFAIDDEKMFDLYSLVESHDFFVVFHTGFDIAFPGNRQADVNRVRNIAEAFSDLIIVTTHVGGWRQWERVAILGKYENIYTETSMTLTEMDDDTFIKTISSFDEDKILFGSDSPWTDQREMVQRVLNLKISDGLKEKILFRNAATFLTLFT